jgi:SAM-dependent methyltransferase
MELYHDFAEVYHQGPYTAFSIQVAEIFPKIWQKYDIHPHTLLDIACGEGSFAVQMALAGIRVTGVDQSPAMLRIARSHSLEFGVEINWIERDMRHLEFPPSFDLVTCIFDSLNYLLQPEDLLMTFRGVHHALHPNSFFIFDMNTIYGLSVLWQQAACSIQQDKEGILEIHRPSFDYERSMADLKITAFTKVGEYWKRFDETHQERGYPIEQIQLMLEDSGFQVLSRFGTLSDFTDPTPESGRVWFVARKSASRNLPAYDHPARKRNLKPSSKHH